MHTQPENAGPQDQPKDERGASSPAPSPALEVIRGARVRGRIISGAYDSLQVVDAIARRLLDTGDL